MGVKKQAKAKTNAKIANIEKRLLESLQQIVAALATKDETGE